MKIRDLLNKLDDIMENEKLSPLSLAGNNGDEEENTKPNMSPVPIRKKKKKKSIKIDK